MATECIVIGESKKSRKLKPIEFCKAVVYSRFSDQILSAPNTWNKIELISPKYLGDYDLIFAYNFDDERSDGVCYLGHWNDGVV